MFQAVPGGRPSCSELKHEPELGRHKDDQPGADLRLIFAAINSHRMVLWDL